MPADIHRKIYKQNFGPIPKDENGRSYEIHHIDGNHYNNELSNLKAVSIQEHYDIHYSQEDWYACLRIAEKMNLSTKEISELATKNNLKRVVNGSNPFQTRSVGTNLQTDRVAAGTHHFLKKSDGTGIQAEKVKNGTHNFLGSEFNLTKVANGTHPSQIKKTCEYCNRTFSIFNHTKWHGNKCKLKGI